MGIKYDLHIHSCLSPCGNKDMTPSSIAGMAYLAQLDVIALTDHNSAKNLPAMAAACREYSLRLLYGIEVCTSEEIHTLCYFKDLDVALEFGEFIEENMPHVKNKPEIYGRQLVVDEIDNILEEACHLLIVGCNCSIYELVQACHDRGGVCYYAHIDRQSFSVLSVLGAIPEDIPIDGVEIYELAKRTQLIEDGYIKDDTPFLSSSDSHELGPIGENCMEMDENHPLYKLIMG